MEKKWLVLFTSVVMVFALAACQKTVKEGQSTSTEQNEPVEQIATDHNHDHGHDHDDDHNHEHDHEHTHGDEEQAVKEKQIYSGYFEDSEVTDRPLTNWAGDWQSVYPYLLDGTFDEVFAHKASGGEKTVEEYKEYYTIGYKTDVSHIEIADQTITFYKGDEAVAGTYEYDGYEILTYAKGNRGVRYIFKQTDNASKAPAYVQFSDHIISDKVAGHYHLYFGDDRAQLLEEMENWPTYYPRAMSGDDIVEEMIAH